VPSDFQQTTISFSGINYSNPSRTSYAYRIKELDNNWVSLGTQNFVNLIGLSPNTYTLEVKAANEDGVWCEPKTLTLIFLPKWYQTAWFKAAIILFVVGIFYGFYRLRMSQIKKQQQIRHEIASDLHDDLGATLNSVKIFTNLAEASPNKAEYFHQIKESINTAYSGLRDMIWVLDDTGDAVEDLLKRIRQFAQPFANANNIHVHYSADSADILELNKTEKRNLLLIAKEAINNCIKYANCKNINVAFTKEDRKIKLVMKDDGCGFDEKEITHGYGLKNIRERAKQINYAASIHSEKGQGTTIVVVKK
jgi:signal transduction histidine kinase